MPWPRDLINTTSMDETFKFTGICGSPRYMAPEVAHTQEYLVTCEVYSFSILVYEILSLRSAIGHYSGQLLLCQETVAMVFLVRCPWCQKCTHWYWCPDAIGFPSGNCCEVEQMWTTIFNIDGEIMYYHPVEGQDKSIGLLFHPWSRLFEEKDEFVPIDDASKDFGATAGKNLEASWDPPFQLWTKVTPMTKCSSIYRCARRCWFWHSEVPFWCPTLNTWVISLVKVVGCHRHHV